MAALYAVIETSKYIFLKVVGFVKMKPLPHGTGARYGRALPIPVVITVAVDWNCLNNYLVVWTSSKTLIMTPNFALKIVISCTT